MPNQTWTFQWRRDVWMMTSCRRHPCETHSAQGARSTADDKGKLHYKYTATPLFRFRETVTALISHVGATSIFGVRHRGTIGLENTNQAYNLGTGNDATMLGTAASRAWVHYNTCVVIRVASKNCENRINNEFHRVRYILQPGDKSQKKHGRRVTRHEFPTWTRR